MSIQFDCSCGQHLQVDEVHAGQQVKCPTCSNLVAAPQKKRESVIAGAGPEDTLDLPETSGLVPLQNEPPATGQLSVSASPTSSDQNGEENKTGSLLGDLAGKEVWELGPGAMEIGPAETKETKSPEPQPAETKDAPPPTPPPLPSVTLAEGERVESSKDPSEKPATGKVFTISAADVVEPPDQPPAQEPSPPNEETPSDVTSASEPGEGSKTPGKVYTITGADVVEPGESPSAEQPPPSGDASPPAQGPTGSPLKDIPSFEITPANSKSPGPPPIVSPPIGAQGQFARATEVGDMPLLDDEEGHEGASPAANRENWYDAASRFGPRQPKKTRRDIKLEQEHHEMAEEFKDLEKTSLGLTLNYFGILALMVAYFVGIASILLVAFAIMSGDHTVRTISAYFMLALLGLGVAACVLNLAGMLLCCWAPVKAKARIFIRVALLILAVSFLVFVSSFASLIFAGVDLMMARELFRLLFFAGIFLAYVLLIVAFSFYFQFIRMFSEYLEEGGIASAARSLMTIWILICASGPVLNVWLAYCSTDLYLTLGLAIPNLFVTGFYCNKFYDVWIGWVNMLGSLRKVLGVFHEV